MSTKSTEEQRYHHLLLHRHGRELLLLEHGGDAVVFDAFDKAELRGKLEAAEAEVRSLQDLQGRYDAALATTIDLSSLPADAHPEDVEKALRDQLLQSTATVSAAADAHLAFATSAGRADAKVARGRAAELYEHLASAIEDAPVPGHLPQSELDLHRQMLDRMAEQRRRQAAALRSARAAARCSRICCTRPSRSMEKASSMTMPRPMSRSETRRMPPRSRSRWADWSCCAKRAR